MAQKGYCMMGSLSCDRDLPGRDRAFWHLLLHGPSCRDMICKRQGFPMSQHSSS